MANVSKMVANKLKVSRSVLQALRVHREAIVAALLTLLFPEGWSEAAGQEEAQGGEGPRLTLGEWLDRITGEMACAGDGLEASDAAHQEELSDDEGFRDGRDEVVEALREALGGARSVVEGAYGEKAKRRVGLGGSSPTDTQLLLQYARSSATLLTPQNVGSAALDAFSGVDVAAMSTMLGAKAEQLAETLEDVARETREAQQTRSVRDASAARWDRAYQGGARVFEGLCKLVGLDDVASQLRPTVRKSAGKLEEDEDEGGETSGKEGTDTQAGADATANTATNIATNTTE